VRERRGGGVSAAAGEIRSRETPKRPGHFPKWLGHISKWPGRSSLRRRAFPGMKRPSAACRCQTCDAAPRASCPLKKNSVFGRRRQTVNCAGAPPNTFSAFRCHRTFRHAFILLKGKAACRSARRTVGRLRPFPLARVQTDVVYWRSLQGAGEKTGFRVGFATAGNYDNPRLRRSRAASFRVCRLVLFQPGCRRPPARGGRHTRIC